MWADCPEQGCKWIQGTHKPSSNVMCQGSDGLIGVKTLALRWHIGKYITGNHRSCVKRKGFGQVTGGKAHHRKGTAMQNLVTGPRWLLRRCRALLALISAPPWGREKETASPLSFNWLSGTEIKSSQNGLRQGRMWPAVVSRVGGNRGHLTSAVTSLVVAHRPLRSFRDRSARGRWVNPQVGSLGTSTLHNDDFCVCFCFIHLASFIQHDVSQVHLCCCVHQ